MAAPRATQSVALRNLARGSQHVRHLHMTGPAPYASPILTKERPIANLARDIAGLRAECKRRKIDPSGSKANVRAVGKTPDRVVSFLSDQLETNRRSQLLSRLSADELAHSRAFSATVPARPTLDSPSTSSPPSSARHFNTSRSLKAVGDSSTIDFAFFPTNALEEPDGTATGVQVRVPILPTFDTISARPAREVAEPPEPPVMKPQISTMSADALFLPLAESSDGHAMNVDFHAMADRVAANVRRMKVPVEAQAGVMKQIWNDMVDDLMGAGKKSPASS